MSQETIEPRQAVTQPLSSLTSAYPIIHRECFYGCLASHAVMVSMIPGVSHTFSRRGLHEGWHIFGCSWLSFDLEKPGITATSPGSGGYNSVLIGEGPGGARRLGLRVKWAV